MYIEKCKVKSNFEMLDKLFLEGDVIYVSESIHTMDGVFDYARKVFDADRNYLGRIRNSYYEKSIRHALANER
jgi:hypothetical protein